MKILVTGRHGQLARSLVERCASHPGLEIVALGRPVLDLEAPKTIAPAIRAAAPDVVINAAAYTAVDQAEDEPDRAFAVNAEAAGLVAAATRAGGARLIHVSTDYVFDGRATEPYDEAAATAPLGLYGRSKLEGERRVRDADPAALIVRTAWVYSPFGRNFVKTMLTLAESRDRVSVVDDQRGSPTSALDLADGLLAAIEAWGQGVTTAGDPVYHLAGSGAASWADVAICVFEAARRNGLPAAEVERISSATWPTRALRPANSMLDSSKFERDFGYRAPDWRESVATAVALIAEGAPCRP
ncbi:MAG TPA: dTDP-4-dehydrorhamnose reductase [Allosphingosinicella sp.]